MGVNVYLLFFYNCVKGEMEEVLIVQNWQKLIIVCLLMLLGDCSKQWMNEMFFVLLFCLLLGNWKFIDVRDVVWVMLVEVMWFEYEGVMILSFLELCKRVE